MNLKEQNIMFLTRTMGLGGTENVVLQLCKILKPKVKNIVVCSCGGVNVQRLKEMGICHYDIPDMENKSPLTIIKIALRVARILRKERITVVHTHHRMAAMYARVLSAIKRFVFMNTSHNTFFDKRSLTRWVFGRAHLIACGEKVKQNLVEFYGLPENQVTVLHNAIEKFDGEFVPLEIFDSLRSKGYALVGNVGRLSEQKGMRYFIDSLPAVKAAYPMVKYIIVGQGEDEDMLRQQVKALGVEEDVVFLGYRSDIQNVISQMDFIVLSSLWEGLPLTPIEAFSVGKTVIGTAVDGTVEIIRDGENGFLVDSKNSEQIAEKVLCLLQDWTLRENMEKAAATCYAEKFSFEKFADRYMRYYEEL